MNKKSLVFAFKGLLLFPPFFLFCFSYSLHFENQTQFDKKYIFFIDFNYINCPICLDSISEVLEYLKRENPDNIIGIVVCDDSFYKSERNIRIISRQIEGFKVGNGIYFPMYIDFNGCFSSFKGIGASLIELNNISKTVIKNDSHMGKR